MTLADLQGSTSELEEIVVHPYSVTFEDVGPHVGE